MNPGKIFSLQVFNDRKVNQQKDLVHHGKEPSSLKQIYSFTLDVIAILKRRAR